MCLHGQQCYRDFTLLLRFNFIHRVGYCRKVNDGRRIKEIISMINQTKSALQNENNPYIYNE